MKKGMFQLAQSKYGCGQAIGQQSYNLEPHKSMRTVSVGSDGGNIEFRIAQRQESESVEDDSEDDFEWPSPSASSNNIGLKGLALSDLDSAASKQRLKKKNRDPLSWFGLPPKALKEAKASFEEALEVIASLASAREKLNSILRQSNSL